MTTDRHNGCARGSIETSTSVEAAFDALVHSGHLASWLGAPTVPLRAGGATRIEFGDGDFFALDRVELARPHRVSYTWRFLGVGPESRITWTVIQRDASTEITVTDQQPERSDREVETLSEGWRDFLDRLGHHLATGEVTRYDWRRDIDGSVELGCGIGPAAARLFAIEALDRWQPWRAGVGQTGAQLPAADGGDPAVLQLVELVPGATELRLAITAPGWRRPTRCELALEPRRTGALLTVNHTGWDQIDDRESVQRSERERFCRLWTESLTRARALGSEP